VAAGVLLLLLATDAPGAHDGPLHGGEAVPGAFATPVPGSYELPPLGEAADGTVLTSEGTPARLHSLFAERIVLLSFIYTRCTDAEGCPLATAVLHRVGARVADEPELLPELRLLSLSFDPERDTPEVMRAYGEAFRRDGRDWRFLTAESEDALAPLLDAYGQTRLPEVDEAGEETDQFAHLLRVFLIDRERRIRQVYSASLLDAESLVADVKTLLLEEKGVGGRGATLPGAPTAGSRPGDDRSGYGSARYATNSLALAARRGTPIDLARRVASPPLGLPPVPVPGDNPITPEKVALGRRLFFDRRLSLNDTISCAMCHVPEQGFASNEMATAVGIEGRTVRRNAPTIYNAAYLERLFHDGRETRLEHQVWGPLLARNEMGNPSIGAVVEKIRDLDDYAERFREAFPGRGVALETVGMALASYERTLVSGGSAFDRHRYGNDERALRPAARRGLALFTGKAGCASCHPLGDRSALFTDNGFHNTGVGFAASMDGDEAPTRRVQAAPGVYLDVPRAIVAQVSERPPNDLGLYEVTQDPADRWKYRTPGLRNAALTAPYMHDGSLATLADVVAFYDRGGIPNEGLDPRIRPLGLSERERRDLVAFLESLTGGDVEQLVADAFAAPIGDARHQPSP
jgi:cytochrome c peroxidase